ncbi:MAG: DUF3105 domain-containing protein, partial [Deltaproteobacteria bacterium]|nr:DUF3105 domain-containing protein [Nannocystaceae bacterium]
MNLKTFVGGVALASCHSVVIACAGSDDADSVGATDEGSTTDEGSSTTAPSTTAPSTSEADATTASTSETGPGSSSDDSGSTAVDPDSSTGEPTCDVGSEPAELTEVEGCAAIIGAPFCSEGGMHVPQDTVVEWMSDPPNSGPHYPTWETWDEHDEVVPRGNWVHNLEHGGIVLSYRCNDDCDTELAVLREVVAERPELRILITADPFLPGAERFAALSWTWVHRFDTPSLEELLCFADQHENHAPEDV